MKTKLENVMQTQNDITFTQTFFSKINEHVLNHPKPVITNCTLKVAYQTLNFDYHIAGKFRGVLTFVKFTQESGKFPPMKINYHMHTHYPAHCTQGMAN